MQRLIDLLSGTNETIPALLCTMNEGHLEDFQDNWQPMLTAGNQPDDNWAWAYKLRQSQREQRYESYAITVENLTEGLIFIETQWHRSHFPHRKRLVYVEAMAAAPWNRRELEDPPFFRNVGSTLLLFARQRSVELGYEGRVGLHALPRAEGFYRRQGMPDYEADPEKEGLVYFEYGIA